MTDTQPPAEAQPNEQGEAAASETSPQTAPLNRPWVIKMLAFLVVLTAVGAWGFYDAAVKYPARGAEHASWAEWQYLLAAKQADANEDFGIFQREASVPDPVAELATLNDPQNPDTQRRNADRNNTESTRHHRAIMDEARLVWLNSLKTIGRMTPEHTTLEDPDARLAELEQQWRSATALPKPLAGYDIPSQWAIMFVCWGIAAYLVFLFLKVIGTRYRWDPATLTLSFSGGEIRPEDLEEVDKRKWDKFIVFLTTKQGHPLAGKELRFDTFRHARLEDWILEMEKAAFGDDEDDNASAGREESGSPESEEPVSRDAAE